MRHARLASLALTAVVASCASAAPLLLEPPSGQIAQVLPPPPGLLVVPRAEASPRLGRKPQAPEVEALRSEGKRHAIERTADGLLLLSEERGVLGFVESPVPGAAIRWVGFVDDDALLIAVRDSLYRAATPDDALAGKLEPPEKIDPAATRIASAGKLVVAAVPGADGAFYASRDGGRHFISAPRPARGAIAEIAVRGDGVIVAAIEAGPTERDGHKGIRAEVWTARGTGRWLKGPVTDNVHGPMLWVHGDAISVFSQVKSGDLKQLGLDAGGRWIAAGSPDRWLSFTWTDARIVADPPVKRPGFATPPTKDDGLDLVGGLMGGLGTRCEGVDCLSDRKIVSGPPAVRAFHDGECAPEHVRSRTQKLTVLSSSGGKQRDETYLEHSCDPAMPVRRPATLLLPGSGVPHVARLPSTCADGEIVATARLAFVHCSAKHRGRPAVQVISASGALADVLAPVPADLRLLGAESASDGTTLLFGATAPWLCHGGDLPACVPVPPQRFLAARPLPGGRALVARRGSGAHGLALELFGEPGAATLEVVTSGQVLDLEVTAEGHVRLWSSATDRSMWSAATYAARKEAPRVEASLVRADGVLVPDPVAKEALLQEIAAARAGR